MRTLLEQLGSCTAAAAATGGTTDGSLLNTARTLRTKELPSSGFVLSVSPTATPIRSAAGVVFMQPGRLVAQPPYCATQLLIQAADT